MNYMCSSGKTLPGLDGLEVIVKALDGRKLPGNLVTIWSFSRYGQENPKSRVRSRAGLWMFDITESPLGTVL
jgi:hypothetical protein